MIKIDFEFETQFGVFRDALHLAEDRVYSHEEIETMKVNRLDSWLAIVQNPSPESSDESLISELPDQME
jgi:hypothetical protein